jgi:microsomal dipeptidase-like Zn-dependent dipeptidase
MPMLQDARARVAGTAGGLLLIVSTLAIAPTAARAQRTPAPTGLEVTGTTASATVTWKPVEGAGSYSVKRWKQDDLKCCNNSVADLTETTWTDNGPTREGFQPGVYVFEVTAQLKGTSGVAVINWTLPEAPAPAPAPTTARTRAAPPPLSLAPAPAPAPAAAGGVAGGDLGAPLPTATPRGAPPLAVERLPAPAPTGVTVTGTPASATLGWQPVAGVASFVVTRQQANVPAVQQALPPTNTGMYDSGLKPATAYTYTVRAIQADGREGSTDVQFTTPPAVNPSGFTAKQTGDGEVQLSWQPVGGASYYLLIGPGSQAGTKVSGATSYTVTGVAIGLQEWAVASIYEPGAVSTGGAAFSRVPLTVTELLSGWVDLHTHPMINLAFGGKLVHGGVDVGSLLPADATCAHNVRATSMAQALGDDRPSHGGWNLVDFPCGDELRKFIIHTFQEANGVLVTNSPALGFPYFNQWPKWNDITHQKMWFEWIRRARDGGLRVMVALATNNKTLADAVAGPGDFATDDRTSADLQLTEIKAFVGRHNDFMEIALGPADIKRIVQANKIAVVLGVEIDNIGNFNTMPPNLVLPMIPAEIQRLYNAGVRYIFPVHVMDNAFGGTAIYKNDFNRANLREAGHFWNIECADVSDDITHTYTEGSEILRDAGAFVKLGLDPFRRSGPGPVCPHGHRNALGLTPYGVIAIKEMMKRGMIVDIDHMSQKAADATLTIAESFGYPLVSGHTGIRGQAGSDAENSRTPRQLERLSKLHGMFGLGSDGAHSTQWARLYQTAMLDMGYLNPDSAKANYQNGAISFGTDLNGLVKGPQPGGGNRVVYSASFPMSSSISNTGIVKAWNYNTEGVAHYGMLADFVKDVRTAPANGSSGVVGTELVDKHLFRSADYFWHMWQRIELRKGYVP